MTEPTDATTVTLVRRARRLYRLISRTGDDIEALLDSCKGIEARSQTCAYRFRAGFEPSVFFLLKVLHNLDHLVEIGYRDPALVISHKRRHSGICPDEHRQVGEKGREMSCEAR